MIGNGILSLPELLFILSPFLMGALALFLIVHYPKIRGRRRFERTFGFPPPEAPRGPGSRPIGRDRKDEVREILREMAREIEHRGEMLRRTREEKWDNYELVRARRRALSQAQSRFLAAAGVAERYGFPASDDHRVYLTNIQAVD